MTEWHKNTLELAKNHAWRSRPGCRIFVADQGAVRFDFPQDWVVIPGSDSIKLHDKEPPDDDCVLAVSYLRLPPIDWSGIRVSSLVEVANRGDTRPIYDWGSIVETRRGDLEIAWREMRFVDPVEQREAYSRVCIARQGPIQALITFEFWESDAERGNAVWDTVLESLELDEHIADPTRGPMVS